MNNVPLSKPLRGLARRFLLAGIVFVMGVIGTGGAAFAAERAKMRMFLEITGFDKAIEGLQDGAIAGPGLAGDAPDAFGSEWVRLAREIFDKPSMIDQTLDMMEAVMPEALIDHGMAFYSSDLGQRLVSAENASIAASDDEKYALAEQLVADMIENDPERLAMFREMGDAIGGIDQSVRSAIEIQVRYLMAAIAAGSSDVDLSEADLRGLLESQSDEIRQNVEVFSILGSAYTYRDFSNAELRAYLDALEQPAMQQVYEVLDAIQFEVMAARYERLAAALAGLPPQTEL